MKIPSLSFAIIGCGRIARTHAKHLSAHGRLTAVCDIDIKKADELGRGYQARIYGDYVKMLGSHPEIDLISVCSPNGLHALHSVDALNYGFHVLCEKPMALNTKDCQLMIATAKAADRQLFVVKQNRYNPPVAALKQAISEGRLGRIYSIQLSCFWNRNSSYYQNSWKGSALMDGGTLFTQFSHFIDLLYWLFGDVVDIHAITGNFGHQGVIEFEDTGVVILKFAEGAIGTVNYTVNSYRKNMEGSLTVFGECGTVKIGGQYLNELEYQEIEDYKITGLPEGNKANNYGDYQGSMSNHDRVIRNVADVLTGGGMMMTTPEEALKTVEIINRIYAVAGK
jgi:UDP-N-acetyl-2-amino-2-deoxyglucuronate dehydrogenase